MNELAQRKIRLLGEISNIGSMRRGQISEQYYEKTNARGEKIRTGPYYVWQASVRGKKRSVRISGDELESARKEIEEGKRYKELCEQLADVMEELAILPAESTDALKKTP
jgi:hypothetical protein